MSRALRGEFALETFAPIRLGRTRFRSRGSIRGGDARRSGGFLRSFATLGANLRAAGFGAGAFDAASASASASADSERVFTAGASRLAPTRGRFAVAVPVRVPDAEAEPFASSSCASMDESSAAVSRRRWRTTRRLAARRPPRRCRVTSPFSLRPPRARATPPLFLPERVRVSHDEKRAPRACQRHASPLVRQKSKILRSPAAQHNDVSLLALESVDGADANVRRVSTERGDDLALLSRVRRDDRDGGARERVSSRQRRSARLRSAPPPKVSVRRAAAIVSRLGAREVKERERGEVNDESPRRHGLILVERGLARRVRGVPQRSSRKNAA